METQEKRTILSILIRTFLAYLLLFSGIYYGKLKNQNEIENRAKQINKECITNQELEIIIFGEKQE